MLLVWVFPNREGRFPGLGNFIASIAVAEHYLTAFIILGSGRAMHVLLIFSPIAFFDLVNILNGLDLDLHSQRLGCCGAEFTVHTLLDFCLYFSTP